MLSTMIDGLTDHDNTRLVSQYTGNVAKLIVFRFFFMKQFVAYFCSNQFMLIC